MLVSTDEGLPEPENIF